MPLKMFIHLRRQTLLIEEMLGVHLNLREGLKTLIVVESPQDGFGGVFTDLQSVFVPEVGRESAVPVEGGRPVFSLKEYQHP